MATGIYGSVRLSDVAIKDIDVFYIYNTDLGDNTTDVKQLNSIDVLQKIRNPLTGRFFDGQYNLSLPSSIFNKKGYYNIYIQPKQHEIKILDCGVLYPNDDIRGVVLDINSLPTELASNIQNNSLVGYRIDYIDDTTNEKIDGLFRIITSNFRVEPTSDTLTQNNIKSIKYIINENSSYMFLTLTPSSAPKNLPNVIPFIGLPNQTVLLTNTFFNPIHLPIKFVEHDFDTLAIGLFGNQTKSISDGIRTYYDSDNSIYKQFNEYIIKDTFSDTALFDVKIEKENIDYSKTIDVIQ